MCIICLSVKAIQKTLFAVTFLCISFSTISQTQTDAVNWNNWVLHHQGEINTSAPPGNAQTEKEIATIKEMIAKRDNSILRQIRYWDAGAPSYRWNEIAYKLAGQEIFKEG